MHLEVRKGLLQGPDCERQGPTTGCQQRCSLVVPTVRALRHLTQPSAKSPTSALLPSPHRLPSPAVCSASCRNVLSCLRIMIRSPQASSRKRTCAQIGTGSCTTSRTTRRLVEGVGQLTLSPVASPRACRPRSRCGWSPKTAAITGRAHHETAMAVTAVYAVPGTVDEAQRHGDNLAGTAQAGLRCLPRSPSGTGNVTRTRSPTPSRSLWLNEKIGVFADAVVRARRDAGHHGSSSDPVIDPRPRPRSRPCTDRRGRRRRAAGR